MRRRASLTRFPEFPISGGIGIIAILVTLMSLAGKSHGSIEALTMNALALWDEPWRLVTSALPHADPLHLLFNVYWLWAFGTALEEVFGHVATFVVIVVVQVGAAAAEYALLSGGIGLSGVGFGLLGLVWVLSRRDPRFAGTVDAGTLRLFAIWFVFCCVVTVLDLWAFANVAHGMGFVLGALIGAIFTWRGVARLLPAVAVAALLAGALLGASVYRPDVNLSSSGADSAYLGYEAARAGRVHDAIRHYRRALELDGKNAGTWYNLGIALDEIDDDDASVAAFRTAHELDVIDPQFREGLRQMAEKRGHALIQQRDFRGAEALLREALRVGGDRAATLWTLAFALESLGQHDEAKQLHERARALDPAPRPPAP
ncbi:MAG: rhomboid family intramembrane serine protease [Deltaproteobacteria bacterium]|nr:rhomboid family intramembrane serine protease [Deltaproteobacteria bacterium]